MVVLCLLCNRRIVQGVSIVLANVANSVTHSQATVIVVVSVAKRVS